MTERQTNQAVKALPKLLPRKWRKPAALLATLILGAMVVWQSQAPGNSPSAVIVDGSVVKVVDGDTIQVQVEGQTKAVRLIGVDTPEVVDPRQPVQCFGQEASDKAHQLLDGQTVRLESDPTQGDIDRYGRLLRYVYLSDNTLVNLQMVQQGYAYEYTYNVPYRKQAEFIAAESQAEQTQAGLWHPQVCNGQTKMPTS